jgi:DNA mismatch endonuclease (patch repair protein)
VFPEKKRREIMSRIRSKSGLDRTVHGWLCGVHIRHRMYPEAELHPDVWLRDPGVYVFIDSCFWHGCPSHFRLPKSSCSGVDWRRKIGGNVERDGRRASLPYRWIRIWEHDVKNGRFKDIIRKAVEGGVK